jgi:histidinol-phosphate aminotransferase
VRTAYAEVSTYDPGRTPVAVDLSDNTNLFGVCPAAASVLSELSPTAVTRYPSVYANALVEAAAERFGVQPASITTGCGSDDVIDSAIRAFCEPGDVIAYPWPTFGIVPTFARMNAARPVAIEHGPDDALDVSALVGSGARLIYVCRPNNPTGASAAAAEVLALADEFDGVLLVDEAYADFAEDDLLAEAVASRNIVVLRTLSKAYGLAGMRIGLAVGPEPLVDAITKSRGPYKIGGTAERAGVAALLDGADWVAWCVKETKRNRDRLEDALRAMGFAPFESRANFVLLPLPAGAGSAREVTRRLRERGVGVRPFEDLPDIGDCVRITVGPWDMMEALLEALAAVVPAPTGGR